jgi:hypothetical protein
MSTEPICEDPGHLLLAICCPHAGDLYRQFGCLFNCRKDAGAISMQKYQANAHGICNVFYCKVPITSMEQLGRQSKILYSFVNDSIASSYFYNMNEAEKTLYK